MPIHDIAQVHEWLALSHAHQGKLMKTGPKYLCDGVPVDHLARVLDSLIRSGHLALGTPDPERVQAVCVTHSGQLRFRELQGS